MASSRLLKLLKTLKLVGLDAAGGEEEARHHGDAEAQLAGSSPEATLRARERCLCGRGPLGSPTHWAAAPGLHSTANC